MPAPPTRSTIPFARFAAALVDRGPFQKGISSLPNCRTFFRSLLFALPLLLLLAACGASGEGPVATPGPQGMPFPAGATRFALVPAETSASFAIDEILLGEPKTVTAVSSGITGELAIDFDNPANTAVGPIAVETAQFFTDNDFRNQAIQRRILISAAYPTVTFSPSAISGLPPEITFGQELSFQMTGDLTITGNTRPVTFDVTVLPISETRLEGRASATINRADFGLVVPSATSVAGVDEEVQLALIFSAVAEE